MSQRISSSYKHCIYTWIISDHQPLEITEHNSLLHFISSSIIVCRNDIASGLHCLFLHSQKIRQKYLTWLFTLHDNILLFFEGERKRFNFMHAGWKKACDILKISSHISYYCVLMCVTLCFNLKSVTEQGKMDCSFSVSPRQLTFKINM
jgi:hypothetical protein